MTFFFLLVLAVASWICGIYLAAKALLVISLVMIGLLMLYAMFGGRGTNGTTGGALGCFLVLFFGSLLVIIPMWIAFILVHA